MRLIMMGTGPFAVPMFRGLYEANHEVVALVTAPIRGRHGRKKPPVNPMRDIAHEHGTKILDPDSVNGLEARAELMECQADLVVVCDYGQILSADTLATARLGGVNLHSSLLPKYRGAAPINWAVYNGDQETGVTVIHMTPEVDAGPCIAQGKLSIDPDETAVELEARLAALGDWLVRRAIDSLEAGRLEALPQDPALASKAPRLKKSDGNIDWSRPARAVKNQIRAMQPWPSTFTFWHRESGQPVRLIIGPIDLVELDQQPSAPGTVVEACGDRLIVSAGATGDDRQAALLRTVQPSGKRALPVAEFLRGYRVHAGDRFGPEDHHS